MARKVIIDVDPGIDDALALSLALADPRLEVVAITATSGNVAAAQATRNVEIIVEQLDPPRWPRVGAALPDYTPPVDSRRLNGTDGLGGAPFKVAELHHRHPSDKVICDEVRAAPGEITLVALGPLTNIAAALQRDPDLASIVGHLIIRGGTLAGPGDVTAAAEFNIYANAMAAHAVVQSPVTKTLIPLDATHRVILSFDFLDQLPGPWSRTASLLRKILPAALRSHHQHLGLEGMYIHDTVGLVAASHPELFPTRAMHGDVETAGNLSVGATVIDRRRPPGKVANMEVVTQIDATAVMGSILRTLRSAD